jgi:hypothetical protein
LTPKSLPPARKSKHLVVDIRHPTNLYLFRSFLYVLGANATQVQVVSLEGPGQAKTVQTVPIASAAKKAGLKISSNMQGMTVFMK